jgi:hypothetical protein
MAAGGRDVLRAMPIRPCDWELTMVGSRHRGGAMPLHTRIAHALVAAGIGALLALFDAPVIAHGGGLDAYGGHRDTKAGNYHAHQGTCAGRTFPSKEAAIRAGCRRN